MKKTVLIVDDAYFMRNLLKKALKEADYEVVGEAKNGKEGIKLFFELKPDVVTMDINMPDINGIEVTKQILSKDPKAKIIAVTGNNNEAIKSEIMEAGAMEYLQKPFQPAFLWNKLDKMFDESEPQMLTIENDVLDTTSETVSTLVIQEAIEDDFDNNDNFEIEILDKPDESKSITLVIENENDSIEYPENYQESVNEIKEEYALTKEKLEEEFEEKRIFVTPTTLPENTQVEQEDILLSDYGKVEEDTPTVYQPVQEPIRPAIPTSPTQVKKPEVRPPSFTSAPKPEVKKPSTKEPLETKVQSKESKKAKKSVQEISIRPQGNYKTSSKEIDIRPPRGKLLRDEYELYDNTDVEEPILNDSEKDKYNEGNNGLFGSFKKLFKK